MLFGLGRLRPRGARASGQREPEQHGGEGCGADGRGAHLESLRQSVQQVGVEVACSRIDIDRERRRISLSLKQANEAVDPFWTEFDPALYGMVTEYDEKGEYKYPEGFDPETKQWKEGFDEQRIAWEAEYAAA